MQIDIGSPANFSTQSPYLPQGKGYLQKVVNLFRRRAFPAQLELKLMLPSFLFMADSY